MKEREERNMKYTQRQRERDSNNKNIKDKLKK